MTSRQAAVEGNISVQVKTGHWSGFAVRLNSYIKAVEGDVVGDELGVRAAILQVDPVSVPAIRCDPSVVITEVAVLFRSRSLLLIRDPVGAIVDDHIDKFATA